MSTILVKRFRNADESIPVFQQLNALFDEIRRRAFSFFEERGAAPGRDLDDWLAAERDILWSPPLELVEDQKEFRIRLMAPGYEPKEIEISAMPEGIVVQGEHQDKQAEPAELRMSEFGSKKMYRRLDLPAPVDPDKVSAGLVNGILTIVAGKATPAKEKKIFVTTSDAA
jgi:HSP20 family protein